LKDAGELVIARHLPSLGGLSIHHFHKFLLRAEF
jgi:hypothetical protein